MSRWQERVSTHAATKHLNRLVELLPQCWSIASEDSNAAEAIERLQTAVRTIRSQIEATDPALIPPATLNSVGQYLGAAIPPIEQYVSSKAPVHLESVIDPIDHALQAVGSLMPLVNAEQADHAVEAVTSMRRALGQHARYLREEASALEREAAAVREAATTAESDLDQLRSEADSVVKALQTRIAELEKSSAERIQQQLDLLAAAETKRAEQWSAGVETRANQFADASNQRTRDFSEASKKQAQESREAERARTSKHTAALAEWQKQLAAVRGDAEKDLGKIEEDASAAAQAILDALNRNKRDAEELMHVIASTGMSGGYQAVADDHRKAARLWKGVAFCAMVGLIVFAIWSAVTAGAAKSEFPWGAIGGRTFAALAFAALATWAAQVASLHLAAERRSRRLQLELASIGPYLEALSEETQDAVRGALAERWFGRDEPDPKKGEAPTP